MSPSNIPAPFPLLENILAIVLTHCREANISNTFRTMGLAPALC